MSLPQRERERETEEGRREKLPRLRGSRRRATPRRAQAALDRFARRGFPAVHNSGRCLHLPEVRQCRRGRQK